MAAADGERAEFAFFCIVTRGTVLHEKAAQEGLAKRNAWG
jgi:hypothetical protein